MVSATDSDSGNYVPFDLSPNDTAEYIVSAVVASASMPCIFPPKNMAKFNLSINLIDGGTVWDNNMISGINKCMQ
jgi:hypothetical protein